MYTIVMNAMHKLKTEFGTLGELFVKINIIKCLPS